MAADWYDAIKQDLRKWGFRLHRYTTHTEMYKRPGGYQFHLPRNPQDGDPRSRANTESDWRRLERLMLDHGARPLIMPRTLGEQIEKELKPLGPAPWEMEQPSAATKIVQETLESAQTPELEETFIVRNVGLLEALQAEHTEKYPTCTGAPPRASNLFRHMQRHDRESGLAVRQQQSRKADGKLKSRRKRQEPVAVEAAAPAPAQLNGKVLWEAVRDIETENRLLRKENSDLKAKLEGLANVFDSIRKAEAISRIRS